MKKTLITFLALVAPATVAQQLSTQQLDSLYNKYLQVRNIQVLPGNVPFAAPGQNTGIPVVKCGFGIAAEISLNINRFSTDQQVVLRKLLARPNTDTSIVSPKGYFKIHFYKSGTQTPKYNVDQFAIAADSAYNFEVNYLGYPPPPPDNGAGGDNRYDIYITNQGNLYGQTIFEGEITVGSNKYYAYTEIDDDFAGFYTTGLNAAKVTVAHEFHHGIQVGNYIFRDSDVYFYELTSTSMETFVYPSIPDYYQYLPSFFNNNTVGFAAHDGYDICIWNIFLRYKYGYGIIKRQWQLMPQMRALNAINKSLTEYNSSFAAAFMDFGVWTYYTNYRAIPSEYFPAATDYPLIRPISNINFTPPSNAPTVLTKPVTNNFIMFVNASNRDTIVAVISNVDIKKGIDSVGAGQQFTYSLFNDSTSGTIKITDNYSAILYASNLGMWRSAAFVNNQLVSIDTSIAAPGPVTEAPYAFPSPYIYTKYIGVPLEIPAPARNNGSADINIYSVSMDLVYSAASSGISNINGHPVISWDLYKSKRLPSGVYIYVVKSGDNVVKGKFVIFDN